MQVVEASNGSTSQGAHGDSGATYLHLSASFGTLSMRTLFVSARSCTCCLSRMFSRPRSFTCRKTGTEGCTMRIFFTIVNITKQQTPDTSPPTGTFIDFPRPHCLCMIRRKRYPPSFAGTCPRTGSSQKSSCWLGPCAGTSLRSFPTRCSLTSLTPHTAVATSWLLFKSNVTFQGTAWERALSQKAFHVARGGLLGNPPPAPGAYIRLLSSA